MSGFLNSLRFRLILLVFLAVLPAAGLIIYNGVEDRQNARNNAQEDALRLSSLISLETKQTIQMTRQLLSSLTEFPAVKNRDLQDCSFLLEGIRRIHPFYTALAVADSNGELVCSSNKGQVGINLADRDYVQRALSTRGFTVSDYLVGRLTGKPSLAFAQPIIDRRQQIQGLVVAAIDLSWLVRIASVVELPTGSSMTIIDSKGRALARWPDPEKWIGHSAAETEIGRMAMAGTEGVAETVGMDGVPRLYGYRPLLSDEHGIGFVYVGIPQEIAYAAANRILTRNLIALGAVIVLGLLAAFLFGHVFIMRGVVELVETSKQLADGNLGARTSISSTKGEIGELAAAFDDMASALQQREKERKQAEAEIRRNADRSRLLSDISDEFIRAGLDYAPVLSSIVHRITEWFGDYCFIHLLTDEGNLSEASAAHNPLTTLENVVQPSFSFLSDSETSLLHRVVSNGNPLLIHGKDLQDIPALLDDLSCHDIFIVPMRADEQVVGTLTLIRHQSHAALAVEDESFLQYVADRAAISISNARLVRTIQQLNAELEERVRSRTVQLSLANKELEAFAYSVSHDLRTPLRAIDGFSRILMEKYNGVLDAKGSDYLQRTRAAAQRMAELIDDLLELSRLTRTEMQQTNVDLSVIVHELKMHLQESQPHRAVDFKIQEGLVVLGDERLLRSALENLLGNSWKFTGKQEHAFIEFGMETQQGEPVFLVRDNGAGFDMQYADKLFGAFQRLHSMTEFPGTGIGLAIAQRVMHRHGGSIWAEGAVGRGATFYFKFPGRGET
ncbi:ATP-binding protein [Desulfomonile tiedjei]|nr:ATP-binding protein [Desulfomonile tiedjei]